MAVSLAVDFADTTSQPQILIAWKKEKKLQLNRSRCNLLIFRYLFRNEKQQQQPKMLQFYTLLLELIYFYNFMFLLQFVIYTEIKAASIQLTYIKLLSICFVSSDDREFAKLIKEQ